MSLSVEPVTPLTAPEMVQFLKKEEHFSLFLLGNYLNYGLTLTEAPYSGNFKIVRQSKEIVAVFCLTKVGTLILYCSLKEPLFAPILAACQCEKMALKGLVGNWEFCHPFWQWLKDKKIIQKDVSFSKEILYTCDLIQKELPSPKHPVRLLLEKDYPTWLPLRVAYIQEEGFPSNLSEKQMHVQFSEKVKSQSTWGLFLEEKLVSIADLNAQAFETGQVGGVYTTPLYRRQGYSRSVMQQLLLDTKHLHGLTKLVIFTGENNFSARALYESLGVSTCGFFALLFGE